MKPGDKIFELSTKRFITILYISLSGRTIIAIPDGDNSGSFFFLDEVILFDMEDTPQNRLQFILKHG
jgi:hypothetical protein